MTRTRIATTRHLPKADAERFAINLFVSKMAKKVTIGIRKNQHYTLKKGQILLSDCRSVLEEAQEGKLVWRIEDYPTFAMIIEYSTADRQWKIIRVDFFYRDRLRHAIFIEELSVLGFRPRKIAALQHAIA